MSLPAILLVVYLGLGVLFAIFRTLRRKKKGVGLSEESVYSEPALFWIALVFWPIAGLLFLISDSAEADKKKDEKDREV